MPETQKSLDRRHGEDANKLKRKNKDKRKKDRIESMSLLSQSYRTNNVPKAKKSKTMNMMQQYPLPARLPSPNTPTQSICESIASPNMPVESTPVNLAIQLPNTSRKSRPSSQLATPNSVASKQQGTPLKPGHTSTPTSRQLNASFSERSHSPKAGHNSERSIFQHAEEEFNQARERCLKMEEELRNVKLEFERVRREQKQEIKTLSTKVNTLEGNAKSLYGHNERLVTENLGLKKEKAELKEVTESIRTHNVTQTDQLRDHQASSDGLARRIIEFEKHTEAQAKTIAELKSSNCSLLAKSNDSATQVAALEEKLAGSTRSEKAHNERISKLRSSEARLTSELHKLTGSEQCLRASRNAVSRDNEKLKSVLSSQQRELDMFNAENARLKETLATKNNAFEEHNRTIKILQRHTAELEEANKGNLKQVHDLESQIDRNGRALLVKQAELEASTTLCNQRAKEIEEKNSTLARLEQRLETQRTDLDAELDASSGENKQLRHEVKAYTGKLAKSGFDCDGLRKEIEGAMAASEEKAIEVASIREQLGQLISERDAATDSAREKASEGDMLQEQLRKLASERDSISKQHRDVLLRLETMRDATLREVATSTILGFANETLSDENRRVLYKAYEDYPDPLYELRFDGWILPRPTDRFKWIGLLEAEEMMGVRKESQYATFVAPYTKIQDPRLEIFVNGQLLRRGFQTQSASPEESHTSEDAGVTIVEGCKGHTATGIAYKNLTTHGEPSRRDIALAKLASAEHKDEEANRAKQSSIPPPDLRLRFQATVPTGPAPVAIMVPAQQQSSPPAGPTKESPSRSTAHAVSEGESNRAPAFTNTGQVPQPDVVSKEPLRPLSTGLVSGTSSVTKPALESDKRAPVAIKTHTQAQQPKAPAKQPLRRISTNIVSEAGSVLTPASASYEQTPIISKALAQRPRPGNPIKQPLRRISTDIMSEAGSIQTPALINDEYMSPRETRPFTPLSPIRQQDSRVSGALKRKEPVDLFDRTTRQRTREPVELIGQRRARSNSMEGRRKRPCIAQPRDPTEQAPREPRRFRESGEAFQVVKKEYDSYDGRRRDDDDDRRRRDDEEDRRASYQSYDFHQRVERWVPSRYPPNYDRMSSRREWR